MTLKMGNILSIGLWFVESKKTLQPPVKKPSVPVEDIIQRNIRLAGQTKLRYIHPDHLSANTNGSRFGNSMTTVRNKIPEKAIPKIERDNPAENESKMPIVGNVSIKCDSTRLGPRQHTQKSRD